jgi:hypothetical protein
VGNNVPPHTLSERRGDNSERSASFFASSRAPRGPRVWAAAACTHRRGLVLDLSAVASPPYRSAGQFSLDVVCLLCSCGGGPSADRVTRPGPCGLQRRFVSASSVRYYGLGGDVDEESDRAARDMSPARWDDAPESGLGGRGQIRRALWWPRRLVVARGHHRWLGARRCRHRDGATLGAVPSAGVCPTRGVRPAARVFSPADVRPATDVCVAADLPASTELCAAPGCHGPAGGRLSKRSVRALRRRSAPAVAVGLGAFSVAASSAAPPAPVDLGRPSGARTLTRESSYFFPIITPRRFLNTQPARTGAGHSPH